ncbi:uncharacterized protein CC84DRAFT_1177308 [Paraphaeosphaeria sporulosa]|uniref:Uncharacterized protein n=1 Tax=Paraphaeosphaeria sporulosa TaxID=1460663 RepID=A0A177CC44_9PLEO|nr:uncharacterized protein CC84DRAFT_1177308 [Paraphaeosphaeria sporulosa]OAG05225.1 hypothetical protein CC84DRAFT_1177308 [Paraphaeosphaeria sporulosa]
MLNPSLAVAVTLPLVISAKPVVAHTSIDDPVFNAPVLTHFLHMNALTSFPVNISDIDGIRGRYPNVGGNLTGAITGTIVNMGAATEWFPILLNETASFYTNIWTINATVPSLTQSKPISVPKQNRKQRPGQYGARPGDNTPSPPSSSPANEYTTIYLTASAHLTYANEFLHGFGPVTVSSSHPAFLDLNVRSFYAEIEAGYRTGLGRIDVFEVKTEGKRDGSPIEALLPPGVEA